MKSKLILLPLLLSFPIAAISQNFHTPDTIMTIIENSSLTYELHELDEAVEPADISQNLNFNIYYRTNTGNGTELHPFQLSDEGREHMDSAESSFRKGDYDEARNLYLKVLETDTGYYRVMTYIAQTYGIQKDYEKALEWYHKVISLNYIDYMAHWFLADIYSRTGKKDDAVREITIAQVLNRNNPRVAAELEGIYKERKLGTESWSFTPQIKIVHAQKNTISLYYDPAWIGYCLVKAIWEFEPGYKEFMGVNKNDYTIFEEKEAIINLYLTASKDKKNLKKQPFKALVEAVNKKMLDEFIIYEIMLVKYPKLAYNLPDDLIRAIAEYVISVRGGKDIEYPEDVHK